MAIVKIQNRKVQDDGETLCEILVSDYARFNGPPGTKWQLVDSLSYQFKSCADEVADLIEAVRSRKKTVQVACEENADFRSVIDCEASFLDECDAISSGNTDARRLYACQSLRIPSLFHTLNGGKNNYWNSKDVFMRQAVRALEYPFWAGPEVGNQEELVGAPSPPQIRIEKDHNLAELWRWLEKRQAERSTTVKKKAGRGRRKAGF
jgi:hypothetical protein